MGRTTIRRGEGHGTNLTEAAWPLRKRHRPLDGDSLADIAAILRRFEDSGLQLADAALAYLAGREDLRTVFTLDR